MKKSVFGIVGGLALVALLAVAALTTWADQSTKGTVSNESHAVLGAEDSDRQDVSSDYFQTLLPSGYRVVAGYPRSSAVQVFQFVATKNDQKLQNAQLAITIAVLPTGGLSEASDYNFRERHPELYTAVSPVSPPISAEFIQHNQTYERAVFMVHEQYYASVVATGNVADASQLSAAVTQTIQDWRWQ